MPLTHLKNQERRRQQRRHPEIPEDTEIPEEEQSPEVPEQPEDGFPVAFAPPPPQTATISNVASSNEVRTPTGTFSSGQQPAPVFPRSAQFQPVQHMMEPQTPTENLKILHQTGAFEAGSVVPASCFADPPDMLPGAETAVERLLRLGSARYTYEPASTETGDPAIAMAMGLARPVMSNRGIPHAPWVQSTVLDILGPAVPRTGVPHRSAGYSTVPAEHGQMLRVAEPIPVAAASSQGTVLTEQQMADAANEGFARGDNLPG